VRPPEPGMKLPEVKASQAPAPVKRQRPASPAAEVLKTPEQSANPSQPSSTSLTPASRRPGVPAPAHPAPPNLTPPNEVHEEMMIAEEPAIEAADAAVISASPSKRTGASRQAIYKRLGFRRTIIPVLLTLGGGRRSAGLVAGELRERAHLSSVPLGAGALAASSRAAIPWGTPANHPLPSLAPKSARVARAGCRNRRGV